MWLRCCDHCDLLSSRGLDLGILNSNGHSALHKAAVKGNHQVCEWHGFQVRFQFSCSLTSSFWPSFIEFSQSVGGFETFGDVSSSFFGHHFEAFGPRRLGRAPGGETLKSKKDLCWRQCSNKTMPSTSTSTCLVSVLNCFDLSSTFGTVFVCMKPGRWVFQPPRWSLMQMAIRRQSWSQNSVFMPD